MATVADTSSPTDVTPSGHMLPRGRAKTLSTPSPRAEGTPSPSLSKIQWTAMMLKAKVAGPQPTEVKQPIKINQYSFEPAPKVADLATKLATKKKSKMPDGYGSVGSNKDAIQRMIAMREDPAFSPKNQPIPVSSHAYTPGRPSTKKHSSSSSYSSPSSSTSMFSSSLPSSPPQQWHRPSNTSSSSKNPLSHHQDHQESESKQKDQGSGSVVPGIEQPLLTGRRRKVGPLVPSLFATGAPVTGDSFSVERLREQEATKANSATAESAAPVATAAVKADPLSTTSTMATVATLSAPSSSYSPLPSLSSTTRGTRDSESTRSTGSSVTTTTLLPPTPPSQPVASADTSVSNATTASSRSRLKVKTDRSSSPQATPAPLSTAPMSSDTKRDSIRKDEQRPQPSPRRHTMGSEFSPSAGTPTGTKAPSFSLLTSPSPSRGNYGPLSSGQTSSLLPPSPSSPFTSSSSSLSSSPARTTTTSMTTTVTPASPLSPFPAPLQVKSAVNPTLRQLQTPHIPTNLVQARIQQNEEKKRHDEELARIPITANLRSVKKIHAVMIDDLTPPATDNLSVDGSSSPSASRPRSRTTSAAQDYMPGGKRRGDRAHIEAVAIPKSLAEKVEGILSRKMAGKGCLLDEMEKLREEEEIQAAKAAALPPIVRGQPRKRALTSSHIKSLVSSWDTKVEAANQTTAEAERSRKFLEERSHARAELPKFLGMNPLIQPPAMPAPPPSESTGPAGNESDAGRASPSSRKSFSINTTGLQRGSSTSLSAPSSRAVSPVEKTVVSKKDETKEEAQDEKRDEGKTATPVSDTSIESHSPQEKIASTTTISTSSSMLPPVPEVERSGEVLVHKAIVSRPRRKNVRAAAA